MDKIKVNTGKSTIFSSCVAIFHNFLNQGFVYMILEEKIVKTSVLLLRDEKNLNQGIEKYFIDLDKLEKKNK